MNEKDKKQAEAIIEQLRNFRWMDKYHTYHKIIPGVDDTPDEIKELISNLVEDCCTELIRHYSGRKKPTVATVRGIIINCMDLISYTDVNTENKDFGYELCWYIAEKIGIKIRKYTETKVYGYWRVEGNQLREVTKRGVRKKKSSK